MAQHQKPIKPNGNTGSLRHVRERCKQALVDGKDFSVGFFSLFIPSVKAFFLLDGIKEFQISVCKLNALIIDLETPSHFSIRSFFYLRKRCLRRREVGEYKEVSLAESVFDAMGQNQMQKRVFVIRCSIGRQRDLFSSK